MISDVKSRINTIFKKGLVKGEREYIETEDLNRKRVNDKMSRNMISN
jgi:hypothetical protein